MVPLTVKTTHLPRRRRTPGRRSNTQPAQVVLFVGRVRALANFEGAFYPRFDRDDWCVIVPLYEASLQHRSA